MNKNFLSEMAGSFCFVDKKLKITLYDKKHKMKNIFERSSAGKTTLMKTLATLLQKQSGSISVCGIPIENAKAIRKIIGYLPQDFSIYPTMNVIEVMDYLGILSGIGSRERKKRIELLLKKVNLIEQKNKKVKALSGGMKRRLGLSLIHI